MSEVEVVGTGREADYSAEGRDRSWEERVEWE